MAARKAGQPAGPQSVMRWPDVDETVSLALDGVGWLPGLRRRCRQNHDPKARRTKADVMRMVGAVVSIRPSGAAHHRFPTVADRG